jgi:hypothetical protein
VRFHDVAFDREERYAIGVEEESGGTTCRSR